MDSGRRLRAHLIRPRGSNLAPHASSNILKSFSLRVGRREYMRYTQYAFSGHAAYDTLRLALRKGSLTKQFAYTDPV